MSMVDVAQQPHQEAESVRYHFWIAGAPFFETELFLLPNPRGGNRAELRIYDADGSLVSEALVSFPANKVEALDLEPFLGACKLEGGVRHGHLVVDSSAGGGCYCRIRSGSGVAMTDGLLPVSETEGAFFPVTLAEGQRSMLCIANFDQELRRVRCKLFCGKRTPEMVLAVPAGGARLLCVESHFRQYVTPEEGKAALAYVRLSARETGAALGFQLVEDSDKSQGGVIRLG